MAASIRGMFSRLSRWELDPSCKKMFGKFLRKLLVEN